jgi:hypothetical protein
VRVLPIDKNELNAKFGQKIIQYLFVTCFWSALFSGL